ncbi:hypothetical protein HYH02_005012 [Chlamydomonas schloesseri]|uniref:Uncharacterized protein n=1 Tax=Chlamydomonas schloesseri TaxID=2026947 RepID=A0A835WP85_9CHLO|nr:hypothetical protein HYH02_005012 [Chlamydomonas schloesseri]|eukprot:KAG2450511.1 hypothetical protein HYH02_005012 [Chlamydomonas schloesseri]
MPNRSGAPGFSRFAGHTKEPRERCVDLLRLLIAVDAFPRGGLCGGYYALCAALRYLQVWQTQLVKLNQQDALPPLDVAWAWLVARQQPVLYRALGTGNGPYATAFQFGVTSDRDRRCWAEAVAVAAAAAAATPGSESGTGAGAGLAGQAPWPPPPPPASEQPWAGISAELMREAVKLAEDMQRFSTLLRSWLRPQFLDSDFLTRAQVRYSQFLELHALHPHAVLVPTADIALMWHTHIALHGEYARSCGELFPSTATTTPANATAALKQHQQEQAFPNSAGGISVGSSGGGAGTAADEQRHNEALRKYGYLFSPDYLRLRGIRLEAAFAETARLYEAKYGEPYLNPDVAWTPPAGVYPAADPAGPLSALLDVFNTVPASASAAASNLALQVPGCLQWHSAVTPRAGGHALFALWLMARTLAEGPPFPRAATSGGQAGALAGAEPEAAATACCGCFGAARRPAPRSERVLGLASVALEGGSEVAGGMSAPKLSVLSDLFAFAIGERIGLLYHMRLLPAWTGHPFFACVRERTGLWEPAPSAASTCPDKTGCSSTTAAIMVSAGPTGAAPGAPDRLLSSKEVRFEGAEQEPGSPPSPGDAPLLSPPPPPQEALEDRVWEPPPSACQGGGYALTDCERFLDPTAPLGPRLSGLSEALGTPDDGKNNGGDAAPAPGTLAYDARLSAAQSGRDLGAVSRRLLGRRSENPSRQQRGANPTRRDKGAAGAASGGSTTDAGEITRRIQDLLRKRPWLAEARRAARERAEEPFDPHVRGLRYTPGTASLLEGAGLGLGLGPPAERTRGANGAAGGGDDVAEPGGGDAAAVRNIPDLYDLEVELQVLPPPQPPAVAHMAAGTTPRAALWEQLATVQAVAQQLRTSGEAAARDQAGEWAG